uniref:DUF927 domain-containing protein n=1 Tax=Paracoccus marcusii TaxID=59779 RepID=J7K7S1_9RHOB|nr:DUF927 domain-containing protein [Paracoccus marcusii]AFQ90334.1 hypothetical protein [Paracoccus marcusii]
MTAELKNIGKDGSSDQASMVQDFINKAKADIPKGYTASFKGICQGGGDPICTLFRVSGLIGSQSDRDWGQVVEVVTPNGKVNKVPVPRQLLESRPNEAIGILAKNGLRTYVESRRVIALLKIWNPQRIIKVLDRSGWSQDYKSYAFGDGRVISSRYIENETILKDAEERNSRGSLAGWQEGLAAACIGNPYLLFAVSTAFSGPLLKRCGVAPAMFHFHGKSSIGKSTLLRSALSVWTYFEIPPGWRSTKNGLEPLLNKANDGLQVFDEFPTELHDGFGDDVYMIANGAGKARATKTGDQEKQRSWTVSVLSSGEDGSHEALEEAFGNVRDGQTVRFIDIHVQCNSEDHGAFSSLHGSSNGGEFSERLRNDIAQNSGHAAEAFIRVIIEKTNEKIQKVFSDFRKSFLLSLNEKLGDKLYSTDPKIGRVLNLFALSAFSGELATAAKITGWEKDQARDACFLIARRWMEDRSKPPAKQAKSAEALKSYLASLTIPTEDIEGKYVTLVDDMVWMDKNYFYISDSAMRQAYPTEQQRRAAPSRLIDAGYLKVGRETDTPKYRIIIGKRRRLYRVCRSIMA